MDVQAIVTNAGGATQTTLGGPEAASWVARALNQVYRIPAMLSKEAQKRLGELIPFPVYCSAEKRPNTGDHAVYAGIREVIRQVDDSNSGIYTHSANLEHCFIGATAREIHTYTMPNAHFIIHGNEAKDGARLSNLLSDYKTRIYETISQQEAADAQAIREKRNRPKKKYLNPKESMVLRRRMAADEEMSRDTFYDKLADMHGKPGSILTTDAFRANRAGSQRTFDVLHFQDCHYELEEEDYFKYFYETGALIGYGYGLLPEELLFGNAVSANPEYKVEIGKHRTNFRFRGAYSQGYSHPTRTWSVLAKNTILRNSGYAFDLNIEITTRIGAMVAFTISRAPRFSRATAIVELPVNRRNTRILDLKSIFDPITGKLNWSKRKYVLFPAAYWRETIHFLMTCSEKSVDLNNVKAFMRRAGASMSLMPGELPPKWFYESEEDATAVATAAVIYVLWNNSRSNSCVEWAEKGFLNVSPGKTFSEVMKLILGAAWEAYSFAFPALGPMQLEIFSNLFRSERTLLGDRLVEPYNYIRDLSSSSVFEGFDGESQVVRPFFNRSLFKVGSGCCGFCKVMKPRLGKQKLRCMYRANSDVSYTMEEEEIRKFKFELLENAEKAPAQLAVTLRDAADTLNAAKYTHTCRTEYILGGPGTGKSYIIKELLKSDPDNTTLYLPFIALLADYESQYHTKTPHKFMISGCRRKLIVDECTMADGRILRYMVAKFKPSIVYVVGDHNQTKMQSKFGQYIGDMMPLGTLSRHSLHVNFRNKMYPVACLNDACEYQMSCVSESMGVPIVKPLSMADEHVDSKDNLMMGFSDNTVSDYPGCETVTSQQGKTYQDVSIVLTGADRALASNLDQIVVAISRQKGNLTIYTDLEETSSFAIFEVLHMVQTIDEELGVTMKPDPRFLSSVTNSVPMPADDADLAALDGYRAAVFAHDFSLLAAACKNQYVKRFIIDLAAHLPTFGDDIFEADVSGFSWFKTALSVSEEADFQDAVSAFSQYGVRASPLGSLDLLGFDGTLVLDDCSVRNSREYFDEVIGSEPFLDEVAVSGKPKPWCFLRALRDAGVAQVDVVKAKKLLSESCEDNGGITIGSAMRVATQLGLDVSLWVETADVQTRQHGPVRSPAHSLILVEGHWWLLSHRNQSRVIVRGVGCVWSFSVSTAPRKLLALISDALSSLSSTLPRVVSSARLTLSGLVSAFFSVVRAACSAAVTSDFWKGLGVSVRVAKEVASALVSGSPSLSVPVLQAIISSRFTAAYEAHYSSSAGPVVKRTHDFVDPMVLAAQLSTMEFDIEVLAGSGFGERTPLQFKANRNPVEFSFSSRLQRDGLGYEGPRPAVALLNERIQLNNGSNEVLGAPTKDAYQLSRETPQAMESGSIFGIYNWRQMNNLNRQRPSNGKFDLMAIQFPRDKKNRLTREVETGSAPTVGKGLFHTGKGILGSVQTVSAAAARYLKNNQIEPSPVGLALAKELAMERVREFIDPAKPGLSSSEIEFIISQADAAARERNYDGRSQAEIRADETAELVIRFDVKTQFKPSKSSDIAQSKLDKVGQGISASSATRNLKFSACFRVVMATLQARLHDWVKIDCGYTEQEYSHIIKEGVSNLPGQPDTAVLDVEEMDASQNWFTQAAERHFLEFGCGLRGDIVEEYFRGRNDYRITLPKRMGSAKVVSAKSSGLNDTFSGNCINMLLFGGGMIKSSGLRFIIIKGDDCLVWGYQLERDEAMIKRIKPFTHFKFSCEINAPMEFCGNAVAGGDLVPDIQRTFEKAIGNRFKDYKHWAQYQISLRDRVSLIWQIGITKCILINAERRGVSFETMQELYFSVVSLSHIDRTQWEEWTNLQTMPTDQVPLGA